MPSLVALVALQALLTASASAPLSPEEAAPSAPAITSDGDAGGVSASTSADAEATAADPPVPATTPPSSAAVADDGAAPEVDPQHRRRVDAVPFVTGVAGLTGLVSVVGVPFLGSATALLAVVPMVAVGATMYGMTGDGWPSLATALLTGIGAGAGIVVGGAIADALNANAPSSLIIGSGIGRDLITSAVGVGVGAVVGGATAALAGSLTNALATANVE